MLTVSASNVRSILALAVVGRHLLLLLRSTPFGELPRSFLERLFFKLLCTEAAGRLSPIDVCRVVAHPLAQLVSRVTCPVSVSVIPTAVTVATTGAMQKLDGFAKPARSSPCASVQCGTQLSGR